MNELLQFTVWKRFLQKMSVYVNCSLNHLHVGFCLFTLFLTYSIFTTDFLCKDNILLEITCNFDACRSQMKILHCSIHPFKVNMIMVRDSEINANLCFRVHVTSKSKNFKCIFVCINTSGVTNLLRFALSVAVSKITANLSFLGDESKIYKN